MKPAIGAALLLLPASVGAQMLPECALPRTKLEAMAVLEGAVVVRGSARIGAVRGEAGALLFVAAKEFSNAASGERAQGIAVELRLPDHPKPQRPCYVDLEEIPGLLAGLEHLSAVERSATSLDEFEADYRTKGGLLATVFSAAGAPRAAVACGFGPASTELEISDFLRFRQLLQSAFERLKSSGAAR